MNGVFNVNAMFLSACLCLGIAHRQSQRRLFTSDRYRKFLYHNSNVTFDQVSSYQYYVTLSKQSTNKALVYRFWKMFCICYLYTFVDVEKRKEKLTRN